MSKNILGATALALLIGVSAFSVNTAALAQNGGDARSNDRANQKKLDDRDLTPVRPIRRVGEDSWPAAKDQPAPVRETSGQSAKETTQEPAKDAAAAKKTEKKEDTARNTQNTPGSKPESKPDTKNSALGNQSPPPDKPQDTAKQNAQPKQDTAKQESKQDAKQEPAKADTKQAQQQRDTAQNKDGKDVKGFASIRLGTDENGRVAVNEAQQRQIAKAIRKQHVENVKVSVGSVAPANVRLVAVSSELVEILPQFRGDSFFVTGDDIVIVEPSSKKVIALVPVKLTDTASRAPDERTTETRSTTQPPARRAARSRDVTVGQSSDRFPTREEILAAPVAHGPAGTTITRTYRSYQYQPDDDDDVVVIQRRRPRFFGFW